MMYNYGYGYGPGMGGDALGFVWHVVIFVIIVIAVIWGIRMIIWGRRGRHMHGHGHCHWCGWQSGSALDILNERYAKGELDTKEYEERKKTLLG